MDATGFAAVATALLGGGGVTAVISFRKSSREAENIAAKTLIDINTELRTELARKDRRIEELEKDLRTEVRR